MSPMRSWPKRAWGGMPRIGIIASPGPRRPLLLHEGAVALVQRPERLLGGDGRAQLVVVPRALGLRRLLDLEEIGGVDLSPGYPDVAFAEERVVGRQLLHLGDNLGPVVHLERLHRLEVVGDARIDSRVDHAGANAA